MESTKIVKSLRKLDPEIKKRFRLYLISPYFNRSKTLLKAFDTISKFIDKQPKKKLSKAFFWAKVFGKEDLKEVNLRKLNSDLLRIFKDFLAQEQFQKEEGRQINNLMRAVHEWEIDPLKSIAIRQSEKFFKETPYRNADYYLQKYIKEKEYYQLVGFDKSRDAKSNVEAILKDLDLFYLSEKLYFYTNSIARKKFLTHEFQFFFIQEILAHVKEVDYELTPAVSIFYYYIVALSDLNDTTAFEKLKRIIEDNINLFTRYEANEIYTNVLNYIVAQLNSGKVQYNMDYFTIFKQMEEKGFLLEEDGRITPAKFRNATKAALRIEEFDWAESFVQKYGNLLDPELQDSTISYTRALIHFRKKEFSKVVPLLAMVEYFDITTGLTAKILLAHAYYELEEFNVLESHIDAFKVFLSRRKDISETRRKNYLKHIQYLSRLLKIAPGDTKAIDAFISNVENDGKIINTDLLLKKAERLR